MRKGILVLLILVVVTGSAFAIDLLSFPPPVNPGSVMIDAGVGLRYLSWLTLGFRMSIPPLFAQVDYALPVGVPISVGGGATFGLWKMRYYSDVSAMYITPYARASWHWGFPVSWLDFYTGLSVGANIASVRGDFYGIGIGSVGNSFYYGFHAGTHFYFSKNVGAVVETGYPYWVKAGIAFKFGGREASPRSGRSAQSSTQYMLVNADSLNVRSGPSADFEAVGSVDRNTRVQVLDSSGQWWKIRYGRLEGYVNSSYLRPASDG